MADNCNPNPAMPMDDRAGASNSSDRIDTSRLAREGMVVIGEK